MQVGIPNLYKSTKDELLTETDQEKVEALSIFFNSVYVKDAEEDIPKLSMKKIKYTINELKITKDDVYNKLKPLDVNKSCGPDGIHSLFLKETAENLCEPQSIGMSLPSLPILTNSNPHATVDASVRRTKGNDTESLIAFLSFVKAVRWSSVTISGYLKPFVVQSSNLAVTHA